MGKYVPGLKGDNSCQPVDVLDELVSEVQESESKTQRLETYSPDLKLVITLQQSHLWILASTQPPEKKGFIWSLIYMNLSR